jgi:hypothetical protein
LSEKIPLLNVIELMPESYRSGILFADYKMIKITDVWDGHRAKCASGLKALVFITILMC